MTNQTYNIFTLPNGLRCVHYRTTGKVSYCGIAVNAGSRDENLDCYGLAHFVEHTIFKGTTQRSSWHISNRMERVGGELNAYTTKEETVIYTVAPQGYLQRGLELIADLIKNTTFPEHELDKEREVVIDEINSYLDSPSETVFDKFEDFIYQGSSMGHNILGSPESVKSLNSSKCRDFIDKFYTPRNMAIYCVDPTPFDKVEREITKQFGNLKFPYEYNNREIPEIIAPFEKTINNNGHQAHTIIGSRIFGKYDDRRFALFLLNNYIGGPCMNSRLNQELRERNGLVYTVDSSVGLMSNCGLFQIYFGCDSSNIAKCKKIIHRELDKLANNTMKSSIFERARRQYLGQLHVSSDHKESRAIGLGKSLLYYNEIHDIEWSTKMLMEVTPQQIRDVAELIHSQNCSSLTIM